VIIRNAPPKRRTGLQTFARNIAWPSTGAMNETIRRVRSRPEDDSVGTVVPRASRAEADRSSRHLAGAPEEGPAGEHRNPARSRPFPLEQEGNHDPRP
jgi:hypothetical protein